MPKTREGKIFLHHLWHALWPTVLLLVIVVAATYYSFIGLSKVIWWDRHSMEVISATHTLEKAIVDVESSVRGFDLADESVSLAEITREKETVTRNFNRLLELVRDNPPQVTQARLVQSDYQGWLAFADEIVRRVRAKEIRSGDFKRSGSELMQQTRADLQAFLRSEEGLLRSRSQITEPTQRWTVIGILTAVTVAIGFTLLWTSVQMRRLASIFSGALREAELQREGLRVTLASIGDAVVVADRNGNVTFLNGEAERMTGWTNAEALGKPLKAVFRIVNEDTRLSVDDPVERVFKEKRVVGLANHTVLISRNGSEWMIEDSASPIFDAERVITGVVLVFQDAGERRKAQRALVRARDEAVAASRAKDDFLAALSHELRTPLNPVLLTASEAATNTAYPEPIRTVFAEIARDVELEARLIDDLLDISRVIRGKMSLDLRPVNPRHALQAAITKISPEAAVRQITLVTNDDQIPATTQADPVRLQQAFWNILKNAVKFSPEGATVLVSTEVARGYFSVSITDHGIGLTREEQAAIFHPFIQGDHAEESGHRFGGLGIGLTIARTMMELQGGTIEAASAGRNQGATFTLRIPVTQHEQTTERPVAAGEIPRGRNILLVEDHDGTRKALLGLLQRRGLEVTATATIEAALQAAAAQRFDLVISDLGLPDGDGTELMKTLRDKYQLTGIALTGYGMQEDLRRTGEAGFTAHLTKPVNFPALERLLAKLLTQPGEPGA